MRIWSLHPRYLDRQGLTACWRETLLAQAVLAGRTRGYQNHPQLDRLRAHDDPLGAVAAYLHRIADEADARDYRYDRARVDRPADADPVTSTPVTTGQLDLEWRWLRGKLTARSTDVLARWSDVPRPDPHPSFRVIEGPVEPWERAQV
ncbi:MAG: pyrimidine dimer DNA glycosylase/endonuclease V [Aeromicrobium sp.]|uniref:pyrimidine dimer DNA glycosylase/endonuclease V n=1 Tax=Aeromicrobium sp. TaxID=1871063 RepID=UPI0039E60573